MNSRPVPGEDERERGEREEQQFSVGHISIVGHAAAAAAHNRQAPAAAAPATDDAYAAAAAHCCV